MLIKFAAQAIFYLAMAALAVYSVLMMYALLRFGKSKILAMVLCAFYLILISTLYALASANFNQITFPEFTWQ